jgi:cytochrome b involved in lipid metabolism
MRRKFFLTSTVLFWLAVVVFWGAATWLPENAGQASVAAAEKSYPLAEIARHATPNDCWMAIGGAVYDLSAYLPQHPSDPALVLPWCGKEATEPYRTKTKGRPHSPYADQLLAKYRIGQVSDAR